MRAIARQIASLWVEVAEAESARSGTSRRFQTNNQWTWSFSCFFNCLLVTEFGICRPWSLCYSDWRRLGHISQTTALGLLLAFAGSALFAGRQPPLDVRSRKNRTATFAFSPAGNSVPRRRRITGRRKPSVPWNLRPRTRNPVAAGLRLQLSNGLDALKSPSHAASIVAEYFPKRAAPLHLAR
jgi:hypothetical protein